MTDTTNAWIWEYGPTDGIGEHDATEYSDLAVLKKDVEASFADYTWEEVERRGIYGTSVLVKQNGRYTDTGHWVYRKPTVTLPWFPGEPGSQWRDVDGDVWTNGDDGYVYMGRRPCERGSPDLVHRKYGPMTLLGGK